MVTVIGAGLAGCEVAWQLANQNVPVNLVERKPRSRSPAHQHDYLAELVCSNSFRSDHPENAVGLLHEELRFLGSLLIQVADLTSIPAGGALAVNRELFSKKVTEIIEGHPCISLQREEATVLPSAPNLVVIASGPLTSEALAAQIAKLVGERLYFYDAIAPILAADSIDYRVAFKASRYGKGEGDDYVNLPLSRDQYFEFVQALQDGEKVKPHSFEEPKYFEGCLPIEVLAERGPKCLAFGPMKPVGLIDPQTGKRPFAVVQLRPENSEGTAYNMVGFQTRLTWPEQKRIFRTLPGLSGVEFLRMGQIHRNTFLNSPQLLRGDLSLASHPNMFLAGQIAGVEGYVESIASGMLTALSVLTRLAGKEFSPPPAQTAVGGLYSHLTTATKHGEYQPSNITFGLLPALDKTVHKSERRKQIVLRARQAIQHWRSEVLSSILSAGMKLKEGS